jgi:hypothetical protein
MFSSKLVEQFYCTSTYADITTTEYTGELNRCGDQITFFRSPRVRVRRGQKDSTIRHDTIDTAPITMVVDKELEFSVKVAKVDMKQICNWDAWQSSLLKSASYNMAEAIDQEVLARMYVEADPTNKGATAGVRSASYDLGTVGAPVLATSANIWEVLSRIQGVLREQCLPMDDIFLVLPDQALPTLLNSPMLNANAGLLQHRQRHHPQRQAADEDRRIRHLPVAQRHAGDGRRQGGVRSDRRVARVDGVRDADRGNAGHRQRQGFVGRVPARDVRLRIQDDPAGRHCGFVRQLRLTAPSTDRQGELQCLRISICIKVVSVVRPATRSIKAKTHRRIPSRGTLITSGDARIRSRGN